MQIQIRRWVKKKKKKKGGGRKKEGKKNKKKNKTNKPNKQKTHKKHIQFSGPNWPKFCILGEFFTILLESLKNQPFWFRAKSFDLGWISVNKTWKSQYCLLFTTMGDDYICHGTPMNIRGVSPSPTNYSLNSPCNNTLFTVLYAFHANTRLLTIWMHFKWQNLSIWPLHLFIVR